MKPKDLKSPAKSSEQAQKAAQNHRRSLAPISCQLHQHPAPKTWSKWSQTGTRILASFSVIITVAASCGRDETGARVFAELASTDDLRFQVVSLTSENQIKVRVAASHESPPLICASPSATTCSPEAPMTPVAQINGRHIYESSESWDLTETSAGGTTSLRWHVFDAQKQRLGGFSLIDQRADVRVQAQALPTAESMRRELELISHDSLKGRLTGTEENDRVADWIISQLQRMGVGPAKDGDFRQRFTNTVGPTSGQTTSNIIGIIEGSDPVLKNEFIVIGAHMDHAGTLQKGYTCSRGAAGDDICNGADDNGSGTITVLNVARALAATRQTLKRSVIVIWFSGEEEGLLGSWHYVKNPVRPLNKTVYMINIDMVGWMRTNDNSLLALGGGSSPVGKSILEQIARVQSSAPIKISERAGGGSDHVPFMSKGIPGVFFHTGVSNNPHYHKTTDSAEKIDYNGMRFAFRVAYETVWRMAEAPTATLSLTKNREPLVTEEEMLQSCHHLIKNPFAQQLQLRPEHL